MKKYTDVDIVAELQKLVDDHVDSYKEDFDIDKRIIRRAAESRNPEEKTLMWFCRPHGTHCLNENQVFIQGTRDHNTFRFYAEQTYDECVARVIVPKAVMWRMPELLSTTPSRRSPQPVNPSVTS